MPKRPARTNVRLYSDENPLDAPGFEAKVKLLQEIDAYARAKDPRVRQVSASLGATWQVVEILRADGEIYRDIRPMVRSMSRSSRARATGRKPAATATAAARAMRASSRRRRGAARSTKRCVRRWSISNRCRRRPAKWTSCSAAGWPGVMLHEAVGHGLEGDFNRKKTSAFAGLMGQQVAAKGVTVRGRRHHRSRAAARSRSTTKARRPTAPC